MADATREMDLEAEAEVFWGKIKDSGFLSGAVVGMDFEDLWPEAKETIIAWVYSAKEAEAEVECRPSGPTIEDEMFPANGQISDYGRCD